MKHFFLIVFFILGLGKAYTQSFPLPPATSNPEKQLLIDEFVEVSHYKETLRNYAKSYIELKMFDYTTSPPKELITKSQAQEILKNFESSDIKFSLYSSFSFISEENLRELIKFYKNIGGKLSKNNSVFLINPDLDFNIKNQLDYIIENINK